MMNQSYWQKNVRKTNDEKLNINLKTDVVIIGGGLTGVSLAYYLKDSPLNITVLDKDEIGSHTSGHTTAKITTLHDILYYKINQHFDIHYAYLYYQSNLQGLNDIKRIIEKEKIDCDYKENNALIYATTPKSCLILDKQKEIFKSLRVSYIEDNTKLASLGLENQAVFHPLKYLFALKKICEKSGVLFYEKSPVWKVEKSDNFYNVFVHDKIISCKFVVHATRYPFFKKHFYYLKLFQEREFVDYREEFIGENSYLCVDEVNSYRPINDKSSLQIDSRANEWYAMDSIPLRGIPYIGRLKKSENEFIAFGFQKWGMTLSHVAARLIGDLILDKDNTYESLYLPQYFSMSYSLEYKEDMITHLSKGYLTNRKDIREIESIKEGEGALVKKEHKLYAVYKDKKGKLYYMSPYCRHLKCVVSFDKISNTWICPCHQSIYDAYGKVLEGPSLYDLKKKE